MVEPYEPFDDGLASRALPVTMVSSSSRHEGDGDSVDSVTDSTNTGIIADDSDPRGRGSSLGRTNDGPGVRNTDGNDTSNIRSQLGSLEMRYIVLRDQMRAHGSRYHSNELSSIHDEFASLFNRPEGTIARQGETQVVIPRGQQLTGGEDGCIVEVDARLDAANEGTLIGSCQRYFY
jgi:hypothetical protein